eukprot:1048674-Alexandrium_andersonii.AAC.1
MPDSKSFRVRGISHPNDLERIGRSLLSLSLRTYSVILMGCGSSGTRTLHTSPALLGRPLTNHPSLPRGGARMRTCVHSKALNHSR